jgi:hypothetical protein
MRHRNGHCHGSTRWPAGPGQPGKETPHLTPAGDTGRTAGGPGPVLLGPVTGCQSAGRSRPALCRALSSVWVKAARALRPWLVSCRRPPSRTSLLMSPRSAPVHPTGLSGCWRSARWRRGGRRPLRPEWARTQSHRLRVHRLHPALTSAAGLLLSLSCRYYEMHCRARRATRRGNRPRQSQRRRCRAPGRACPARQWPGGDGPGRRPGPWLERVGRSRCTTSCTGVRATRGDSDLPARPGPAQPLPGTSATPRSGASSRPPLRERKLQCRLRI